jgi:polysaccharide biosynthesis protein PslH
VTPLNVLFLSQIVPFPPHGGVLQRGFNLVRELGRRCHVHLLAFVHPEALPDEHTLDASRAALGPSCRSLEYFPLWAKRSRVALGSALAASACSPSTPFSVIAHRSEAFGRRVKEMLASHTFDVVHVDTIALSQFVDLAGAVPTVLTHHNIESQLMARRASVERRWYARRFLAREASKLKRLEMEQSPRFGVNVVMSAQDGDILKQMAPAARLAVVPNGVDIEYFEPDGGVHETQALIYTGGMNMFANRDAVMHFLTAIWPAIRQQVPSARFVAVGQDPPPELRELAGRDSRIEVTGYVSDIRPYVRQAAVYVVPLRVGGGTRLKVLDAMAMGKALVSTSVGCEGLAVCPGEHLVVADAVDEFAERVVQLMRDPGRRRELGAAARRLVTERYAWSIVADQLLAAYDVAITAARTER